MNGQSCHSHLILGKKQSNVVANTPLPTECVSLVQRGSGGVTKTLKLQVKNVLQQRFYTAHKSPMLQRGSAPFPAMNARGFRPQRREAVQSGVASAKTLQVKNVPLNWLKRQFSKFTNNASSEKA